MSALIQEPDCCCCFGVYAARSFGWWLMAGVDLLREKSTVGWLLVVDCSERKVLLAGG
jgi:hypothetical protein